MKECVTKNSPHSSDFSQFLLKCYIMFLNLYIDEQIGPISFKNPILKNKDTIPQNTQDNFPSHDFQLSSSLTLFHSGFGKIHDHSHSGLNIAEHIFKQYFFQFWKMGYEFLFLIVLITKFINIKKDNNKKLHIYPF